ncbi:Muscle-specific protein 20 [Dictyocoela muelleri]|nr:Muscle-specific protein 20 [Dictyocoela muelleri]
MFEKEESEIKQWIETILDTQLPSEPLQKILKDGSVLCELMNKIKPNSCTYKKSPGLFIQRENINNFITCAKNIGVPDYELFQSNDLLENKNFKQVIICIYSLNRHLRNTNFEGPFIGPKLATKNEFKHDPNQNNNIVFSKQMMGINTDTSSFVFDGVGRQIVDLENYRKDHKPKK